MPLLRGRFGDALASGEKVAETVVVFENVIDQPRLDELHGVHFKVGVLFHVRAVQLEDRLDHRFVHLLVFRQL